MDESNGNSNTLPPFLLKTYEMVDEPSTNSVVSWSPSGLSFIVWNSPDFARDLLPKYFKHNNFSSFIRQLNTYGFRKIDPDQWEFANVEFIRGQRHLLKNIYRRKPIHSHSGQTNGAPSLSDREREEFAKMIENLKREKHSLQSEVDRYKYENREYENQLVSLGQTLQNIDQRQKQLTITLSRLLQEPTSEPASTSQFIEQTNQNKKRRVLALQYLHREEEGGNPGYQSVNMDLVEKLDSSLNFWEDFIDQIPSDHHHYRYDLNAYHNDDVDDDCCCSLDQMGAVAPDSPPISSICIDLESNDKPSDIITTVDGGAVSSCDPPKAEVNDVFWQQFLTEAPSDSSVTQSDTTRDGKKDDGSGVTNYQHKPWWIKCGS